VEVTAVATLGQVIPAIPTVPEVAIVQRPKLLRTHVVKTLGKVMCVEWQGATWSVKAWHARRLRMLQMRLAPRVISKRTQWLSQVDFLKMVNLFFFSKNAKVGVIQTCAG
jgi:hypothetical protein